MRRALAAACLLVLAAGEAPPARAWTFDWAGRVELDAEGLSSEDVAARREAVQQLAAYDITLTERYLLTALEDKVLDVRLDAARALGRGGSERAVSPLVEWLSDPEVRIRVAAAEALGEIGGPQAKAALTRSLGDLDHGVRQRAVRALGAIGKRGDASVVTALLPRLTDDKADVRREAVEQLEALADRRALIPLVTAFADNHPEVRKSAVRAVGRFGEDSVVPALLRLLRDPSEEVRSAAVGSLGSVGSPQAIGALSDVLSSGNDQFRSKVAYALGQIARHPAAGKAGEAALAQLVGALATGSLRSAAAEALRVAGPAATPALLRHLAGKIPGDPTTAVRLLSRAKDPRATAALTAELDRRRVALPIVLEALGATGDPQALVPVLGALTAKDPLIRLAAMNALRPLLGEDGRASDVLIERLGDTELEVRVLAAEYLGRLRARNATAALLALASADAPVRLRRAAIDALGEIADERSSEPLLQLLRRGPAPLRAAVATALSATGASATIGPLTALLADPDAELRRYAARALAGALRRLRAVGPADIRTAEAAGVVGAAAVPAAFAALARAAADNHSSVAVTAIFALAASGQPSTLPALRALATSAAPDRRRAALAALADLVATTPDAHQALPLALDALAVRDDRVAADAAWAAAWLALGAQVPEQLAAWDRLAFAARRGGWATSVCASAALARLARQVPAAVLDAERMSALHLLSRHRSRLVRGNVGLALVAVYPRASAELRKDLLRLLAEDKSARVRATLAAQLAELRAASPTALDPALAAALTERLAKDASQQVRGAATAATAPSATAPSWRIFEIVEPDAEIPVRNHPYFLVGADRLVRGVYTDANGEIVGERMPGADAIVLPASRENDS